MPFVRPAKSGDEAAIRKVHLKAFPTASEAELVEQLNADGDAVISLVAEDAGEIVGHILFSRMKVESDGTGLTALGLAPVSVLPERQGQGIGGALIKAGLAAASARGAEIVFVVGEPAYYGRFGFDPATAEPFASPYAGPYLQAKLLTAVNERPNFGRADYAPAFAGLE